MHHATELIVFSFNECQILHFFEMIILLIALKRSCSNYISPVDLFFYKIFLFDRFFV